MQNFLFLFRANTSKHLRAYMSTTEDMHIHVADEFDVPNRRSNWHASGTLTHAQKYFLKKSSRPCNSCEVLLCKFLEKKCFFFYVIIITSCFRFSFLPNHFLFFYNFSLLISVLFNSFFFSFLFLFFCLLSFYTFFLSFFISVYFIFRFLLCNIVSYLYLFLPSFSFLFFIYVYIYLFHPFLHIYSGSFFFT